MHRHRNFESFPEERVSFSLHFSNYNSRESNIINTNTTQLQ